VENERAKCISHALAESFGFVERPDASDHLRFRMWERASIAIFALRDSANDFDPGCIRVIVFACGQLGAYEPQAHAAHLAGELGVDLRSVLEKAA
jgi:hypothetical protein